MTERRYDSDEPLYQKFADFSAGMAVGLTPGVVPAEACLWAINVDPARGGLRSRYGRQRMGNRLPAGSSTCYWLGQFRKRLEAGSVNKQVLRINSADLFELVPHLTLGLVSGTWTFRGSVSSERITTGLQFANRMWYGDGIASGRVWDGDTLQPWGQIAPGTPALGAQISVGGNLFNTKVYQIVYTLYSTTTTEETNPSEAVEVTISTGTDTSLVELNIPDFATMPTRFDAVKVYRSPQGEAIPLYESQHSYDGSVSLTVDIGVRADADLGSAVEYDNDPPPKLSWFTIFENKFFGSGPEEPSTLVNSKTDQPWAWPPLNTLNINLDDGDEIVGGLVLHGTLFVFKRRSAHAVAAHPIFGYGTSQLPADVGLLSHHSLVVVGNFAYGYDDQGIWRFNGAQFTRQANLMLDFFVKARRNPQSLRAVAVRDARLDRPYYRLVLDGPDPRDQTVTKSFWVNLLEPTGGIFLIDGWSATYVTHMDGEQVVNDVRLEVQEIWSGDDQGAVYRHFEDAEGNALYFDEDPDAVPQEIELDFRSPDIAFEEGEIPDHEDKLQSGWIVTLERSDVNPPTLLWTSYLDGVMADQKTFSGHTGGKVTEARYWRLRGTPHRRAGFRFAGTGSYDARLASMTTEFRPLGLRLPGEA